MKSANTTSKFPPIPSPKLDSESQTKPVFDEHHSTVPDGGFTAWSTVAGAWFTLAATYGYAYAFGVYQDYYTRIFLTNKTPSQISWIGGLQYMMPFLVGVLSGGLFDRGFFHSLQIIGGILFTFSLFMLSLAQPNHYYQVFLSQGLGMGLGLGLTFVPTIGVLAHHFRRRRALAGGIALSGTAIGAVVFPIMLNNLLQKRSFGQAVRATAYLASGCLVLGNLLMRTRLPPRPKDPPAIREWFREAPYVILIFAGLLLSLGINFPVFYIQLYAINQGLNTTLAFYSLAILNASSAIGRIIGNFFADYWGPLNISVIATFGTGILIWAMLGIETSGQLIAITILYGFFSGAYLSLGVACLASLSKSPSEVGARTGIGLAIVSVTFLVAQPLAGALLTTEFHWIRPIAFSGTVVIVSGFFYIICCIIRAKEKGHRRV